MAKRVGVVLSGCGVFDGSEIHEAVSILIALDKRQAQIICMAPDISQPAVNHLHRNNEPAPRNILAESARIARVNIKNLATIKAEDLDALIFPGGFGAVKNLSTFAADGADCKVNPQVTALMVAMHAAGKPIGLACIAPTLAAAVFGKQGIHPKLTIGTDQATAAALQAMGAEHHATPPTHVCLDLANKLVTTPCYMTASGPWEVFQGADRLVEEVLIMA